MDPEAEARSIHRMNQRWVLVNVGAVVQRVGFSEFIYSWVAGKKHYNLQPHKLSRVKEHKLEHPLHCVVEKMHEQKNN